MSLGTAGLTGAATANEERRKGERKNTCGRSRFDVRCRRFARRLDRATAALAVYCRCGWPSGNVRLRRPKAGERSGRRARTGGEERRHMSLSNVKPATQCRRRAVNSEPRMPRQSENESDMPVCVAAHRRNPTKSQRAHLGWYRPYCRFVHLLPRKN